MARFFIDENITPDLALALRRLGHSATTTEETGRKGQPDHDQLWYASNMGAILITANAEDFFLLNAAWSLWEVSRDHHGIIAIAQFPRPAAQGFATVIHAFVTDRDGTITNGDGALTNRFYFHTARGIWK